MLPKKPDRDKTYWKITNDEENHRGLQYKTGLIIDPKPFNDDPTLSCVLGGIYFTTKEYIHRFLPFGTNLRPVKIPKDARVVLDLKGDKYRADKLVFREKKNLDYYFDHLFDKETFPKKDYWYLMKHCSDHFDKWFDKETFPREDYNFIVIYCSKHFDKWFDKKIFPKKDYQYLAEYCSNHFDIWFDKKTFPKKDYWSLAKNCQDNFSKWFDRKTFPEKYHWYLERYCKEYKHIWEE